MDFEQLQTVRVTRTGGVATLLLNRPERLNAYTLQMGAEIYQSIEALDRDDEVRAIVVTGQGRAFCAGMDLDGGGETFGADAAWERTRALEKRVRPWNIGTPIIAAINGPAVGIGATLPLHFDIRIAGEAARFGYVFTRIGITPELASTWILPRWIGASKAMELLLTGRIIDAAEALDCGLVSQVVPDAELQTTAHEIAADIAANTAPLSVAITKRLVWRQLMEPNVVQAKRDEDELFDFIGKQADAAEGVRAFLEKRPPAWSLSAVEDLPPQLSDWPDE